MIDYLNFLAQEAYDAYGESTNYKNFRGEPMPAWENLPEKIQNAWVAAARRLKGLLDG